MEIFKILGTISIQNSDANATLDDTVDRAEQSENKISGAFKKIGAAVATYFAVDKIKDFGVGCVEAAAEIQAQNSAFEQTFGDLAGAAQKAFERVGDATGIMSSRLKTEGTKAFSMFKGAGMDANDALVETETFMNLAADAAAYYDISLEDASARVLGFAKGNFENGDAIGVFTNEAQRNTIAMEQYGKKYSECTEAQKQMMALDMIQHTYELSGAIGQATREADGYENVMGNLKEAWRQFQAIIGAPILQAVIPILQKVTAGLATMGEKAQEAGKWMGEHKTIIAEVGVVIGTLTALVLAYQIQQNAATIATKLWTTVSALAGGATGALTTAFGFLVSPIGLVILAIGALVAIGVALYKNWDTVKEKATELWQKVTETFENLKNSISEKVESTKTAVTTKFSEMKDRATTKIEELKAGASDKFSKLKDNVTSHMEGARNNVQHKLDRMKQAFEENGGGIKGVAAGAYSYVKDVVQSNMALANNITGGKLGEITDAFSNKLKSAKKTVDTVLSAIRDGFREKLDSARDTVSNVIEKIKSLFNFSWKLPDLKLPHPKISGEFSLSPPSVPHISVDWYKKAMNEPRILTEPTVFGINSAGQARAGGEAGDEVVSGKNTLLNLIRASVAAENRSMNDTLVKILNLLMEYLPKMNDLKIMLDTGVMVGALSPAMAQVVEDDINMRMKDYTKWGGK